MPRVIQEWCFLLVLFLQKKKCLKIPMVNLICKASFYHFFLKKVKKIIIIEARLYYSNVKNTMVILNDKTTTTCYYFGLCLDW